MRLAIFYIFQTGWLSHIRKWTKHKWVRISKNNSPILRNISFIFKFTIICFFTFWFGGYINNTNKMNMTTLPWIIQTPWLIRIDSKYTDWWTDMMTCRAACTATHQNQPKMSIAFSHVCAQRDSEYFWFIIYEFCCAADKQIEDNFRFI